MLQWIIWACILMLQNAAFTWVSRARNSANVKYHAIAAVCSNGLFFVQFMIGVDLAVTARESGSVWIQGFTLLYYIVFTVIGSVASHKILMSKVEKGDKKVGA